MLNISFLLRKENFWLTITNFLLLNIISIMRAAIVYISFFVFEGLISQGLTITNWDFQTIVYLSIFAALFILDPIFLTIFNYLFRIQIIRSLRKFSENIYDSFYSQSINNSKKWKKEQILNMVTNDFPLYMQSLINYVMYFTSTIISGAASIVFVGLIDWILLLLFLSLTITIIAASYVSRVFINKIEIKKSRINEKFLIAVNKKFSVFIMYLNNGYKIPFINKILEIIGFRNKQFNQQENRKVLIGIPSVILTFFSMLIVFGILWAIYKGTPNTAQIATIAIGITNFRTFLDSFDDLIHSLGSRNQYKKFEAKINELYSDFTSSNSKNYNKKISTITLENINFSVDEKNIITDLNLKINKGDKILISGPSGSGKSTIISMILNELKPTSGRVLINNTELDENTTISNKVSYAYNENFIIDGTLAENITFEKDANLNNSIIRNLTKNLMIDYINDENENINSLDLSEGQKQKIVLARALYQNKDIYILDEVISNLDTKTKNSFENILSELNKTVIFISHTKLENTQKIFNQTLLFDVKKGKWNFI